MIINHDHEKYKAIWDKIGAGRWNGAYYYSKEICDNIIPRVNTDRNWITIKVPDIALDYSIVFIHNNLHMEYYDYLNQYEDLILVCGTQETANILKHRLKHKTIYLPLSVDVEYVKQFARPKTKDTAYIGRIEKKRFMRLPLGIDNIYGMEREKLLPIAAQYKNVYAVGRTAIECRILDCNIINADRRYPNKRWRILDNKDAAKILQEKLDKLGG